MIKTAFVMPAYNKIHAVKQAVRSVLEQTYSPMELIFSDHGSTDGTRQVIEAMCAAYNGPNTIRIIECPLTDQRGMVGLNRHIDWIMSQTDADVIVQCSADDTNEPKRAEKVVKLFDETGAAMVNSGMNFMHMDGQVFCTDFPAATRFVTGAEVMKELVGGSSAPAWRHDFYDRIGGLHGAVCPDVFMPYLATQDKGLYYLHEMLYWLIRWPDMKNTGLGGRELAAADAFKAASTDEERFEAEATIIRLKELVQYQLATTFTQIYKKCCDLYPNGSDEDKGMLVSYIMGTCGYWAQLRDEMTVKKIQPDGLPI